ncbi:hypothetical protein [Phenylobacterium sp.]|jgi:hypothetical protein|uniref:hypothetical protein n=1 Tax=Phenylobacterium sp. TaxID=1871053 RepID=UPI002E35582D|nr:hypothetical protein [Phenylobacterium sp.]HEX3363650.1 hypothetical protein [Phenylobacterium sp.]
MRKILLAALALAVGAAALEGSALAQPAPPAGPMRPSPPAQGMVVAFNGKTLTVKDAHGLAATYAVADDARILRLVKIDAGAIKPGSFVATANVNQPDGSGVSKEFRVFAPALKGLGEGHFPMAGEAPGTMMTNGTVTAEVVSTPRGREMDVIYSGVGGQGVRHVVLPADVPIREMSLVDRAQVKAGIAVEVRAARGPDGLLVARAILVGENGQPPAS